MVLSSIIVQLGGCITSRKEPQKLYDKAVENNWSFDAIIVPGIAYQGGRWDSVMKARVIWSWILYKNGLAKNIIYSGAAVYSPYKEAVVMGLYARKLGIPREHIFYDTNARHSTENIYYSYLLAMKQGFKSIALATDPFQAFLLKGFLKKRFGSPIYRLPFVSDTVKAYNYLHPEIDPQPARVENANFTPITESESFFQRIRGTMGKGINWKKYKGGKVEAL